MSTKVELGYTCFDSSETASIKTDDLSIEFPSFLDENSVVLEEPDIDVIQLIEDEEREHRQFLRSLDPIEHDMEPIEIIEAMEVSTADKILSHEVLQENFEEEIISEELTLDELESVHFQIQQEEEITIKEKANPLQIIEENSVLELCSETDFSNNSDPDTASQDSKDASPEIEIMNIAEESHDNTSNNSPIKKTINMQVSQNNNTSTNILKGTAVTERFYDDSNPLSPHKKQTPVAKFDMFGLNDDEGDGFFGDKNKLKNSKIDKLVNDLGITNREFELDSQIRGGGFNKSFHYADPSDPLDHKLNIYLSSKSSNSNVKEFVPLSDPVKKDLSRKAMRNSTSQTQPSGSNDENHDVFFKPPTRRVRSNHPSSIPRLRPLTNLTNLKSDGRSKISFKKDKFTEIKSLKSPKRICSPSRAKAIIPHRPSIKFTDRLNLMVDSSSGSVFEATKYATEINSINAKNVPLPNNIMETVEIPTIDESRTKKLAIIKGINNKFTFNKNHEFRNRNDSQSSVGFYNKDSFNHYFADLCKKRAFSGEIIDAPPETHKRVKKAVSDKNNKKSVKWARELEW